MQEKISRPFLDSYIPIQGWCSDIEAAALQDAASGKVVLEIGTWKGRSAIAMGATAIRVIAVDHFKGDSYTGPANPSRETIENVYPYREVIHLCMAPWSLLKNNLNPYSFGFIYYDACHLYEATKEFFDWVATWRDNHPIPIGLHDVDNDPNHEGVKRALLEYTTNYSLHDRLAIIS